MRTKKINVEFEEVKVCDIMLDLGSDIENYMSKFLALKNQERNIHIILKVTGFNKSNHLNVVILMDAPEEDEKEVRIYKNYIKQFGKILSCEVKTAWIINDSYSDGLSSNFGDDEWYVYDKRK